MPQTSTISREAIVLRSRTLGENDLLIDFLTPDLGRLVGRAANGRLSQKRFGTVLQPPQIVQVRYKDKHPRVFLEEASLVEPLSQLFHNLEGLLMALYMTDLVLRFLPEGHASENDEDAFYGKFKKALRALNEGKSPPLVCRHFEYHLLQSAGYKPELEHCLSCGKSWNTVNEENGGSGENEKFFFVFREGGIFCDECRPFNEASELLRRETLHIILGQFIEYQIGRPLKSRQVLSQVETAT